MMALLAGACIAGANAQESSSAPAADPAPESAPSAKPLAAPQGSGNSELMLFDEVPTVFSATRQAQPINLSPVPVSVISKEAIHFSGATNLPELLQFYPGMDVLRLDRNNYAVGVRGFHHTFSDRTLLLVDGRNASNTFIGSINLLTLPILMEDIERVEIVRGPGGAAWGANAFNGVINIITKKPGDDPGFLMSSTLTQFGDTYNQLVWSGSSDAFSWRASGGYEKRESAEDAITHDEFSSRDFSRNYRLKLDGSYGTSPDTKLTFGIAHSHVNQGGYGFAEYDPMTDERLDLTRMYTRLDHTFEDGSSGYVQLYHNRENSEMPQITNTSAFETDLDTQYNFKPWKSHHMSIGGNIRGTHAKTSREDPEQFNYAQGTYDEWWLGAFVMDRWDMTDRFTSEAQIRGDYYDATASDASGRVSGFYAIDEAKHHMLRLSGAKAFRAPLPGLRDAEFHRAPLPTPPYPPGLFGLNLSPTPGIQNEQVWTIEAGYYAQLTEQVTLRADAYHQWYQNLVGVHQIDQIHYTLHNDGNATAPGAEIELSYKIDKLNLSAWYAYNGFDLERSDQDIRAFQPSPNKVGATARYSITEEWTLAANYRWSDVTPATPFSGEDVSSYHRFDLAMTRSFAGNRGEALIGIQDIFDQSGRTVTGVGAFNQHSTPGRELFARLQFKF